MASTTRGSAGRSKATSHEPVGAAERLGRALPRVRATAGSTLEVAAERFGLDRKHLQRIVAGGQNVTHATLERIGAGLGFDLGSILDAVILGRSPKPRAASAPREGEPIPVPVASKTVASWFTRESPHSSRLTAEKALDTDAFYAAMSDASGETPCGGRACAT